MQKKLKLILCSLKDKEISRFFESYCKETDLKLRTHMNQISYNCYESTCQMQDKVINGYGRTSDEAYLNNVRTIAEMLTDNVQLHSVIKDCIRKACQTNNLHHQNSLIHSICQGNNNHNQSRKKFISTEKQFKIITHDAGKIANQNIKINQLFHLPLQKQQLLLPNHKEQKITLKQQILSSLNLQSVKISNPNNSKKVKPHQKYMSHGDQEVKEGDQDKEGKEGKLEKDIDQANSLKDILKKITILEEKLSLAQNQNQSLKITIMSFQKQKNLKSGSMIKDKQNVWLKTDGEQEDTRKTMHKEENTRNPMHEENNYVHKQKKRILMDGSDTKNRSASVQSHKEMINPQRPFGERKIEEIKQNLSPKGELKKKLTTLSMAGNEEIKKMKIPKLNLQILPNYHGKSNKSLNQSLLEAYEKANK